jgi:hypothetical protein
MPKMDPPLSNQKCSFCGKVDIGALTNTTCNCAIFKGIDVRLRAVPSLKLAPSPFDLDRHTRASISIEDYSARIRQFSDLSDTSFVIASIYLTRLTSVLPLSTANEHKLFLISVLCASKYYEDDRTSNRLFSMVGGLSLGDINKLELQLLDLLEWKLYVSLEEICNVAHQLRVAGTPPPPAAVISEPTPIMTALLAIDGTPTVAA